MTTSWLDVSEITMGKILRGAISPNSVNPNDLAEYYPRMLRLYLKGTKEPEELMERIGIEPYRAAIAAADKVGKLKANYPRMLEKIAAQNRAGDSLIRIGQQVKEGDSVSVPRLLEIGSSLNGNEDARHLIPLTEVRAQTKPFTLTGYSPLDRHVGGLPKATTTIIAGPTGVGKTMLLLKIISKFVKKYKKKRVAFFSLEMTMQQIAHRAINTTLELTKEQKSRILLSDRMVGPDDIGSIAALSKDVHLIGVDFAELLLESDASEQSMSRIYLILTKTAKQLKVPLIVVSQLSRGYTNTGGIPRLNHIRYTAMGEMLPALVLMIYNPSRTMIDFDEDNEYLPFEKETGYLIVAKSRFGTKHSDELGAIQVPWDGAGGWGDKPSTWHILY